MSAEFPIDINNMLLHSVHILITWHEGLLKRLAGDITPLLTLDWTRSTHSPILSIIAALVQSLFAWRVWKLLGDTKLYSRILFATILCLAALNIAMTGWYEWRLHRPGAFLQTALTSDIDVVLILSWIIPSLADLCIFGGMTAGLLRARMATPLKSTRRLIQRCILLSIETNLATSLLCIIITILVRLFLVGLYAISKLI